MGFSYASSSHNIMILFRSSHLNLISGIDDIDRLMVQEVDIGGGWQVFGLPLGYLLGYKFNYGVGVTDILFELLQIAK